MLIKLPEMIRGSLEGLLEDLKSRESTMGIGLFGSWSRGDAVSSSDVDLLILDSRDFNYDYVERLGVDESFVDLNYIPEKWVRREVPPEIDQRLHEAQVLFDRDGTLTKMKELMSKIYWKPERVDIRTESHLMEADAYMSRAKSARNMEDLQSTSVYSAIGLESLMKILIEVNRLPISNSHFIEALKDSSEMLGMEKFYNDYMEIAGLLNLDKYKVEGMLNSFSTTWNSMIRFIGDNASTLKTLHVKVRNKLNYYGKDSFMRGMQARSKALFDAKQLTEAAHYMSRTLVDMLENYVWLVSAVEGTRFDYTLLFNSLRGSKKTFEDIYTNAVDMLRIGKVSEKVVDESLKKAWEIVLHIRRRRKGLIIEHLEPSS